MQWEVSRYEQPYHDVHEVLIHLLEPLMKDIDGIEGAMKVLLPHWREIEADFNRQNKLYLDMAGTDHQVIGRVLRVHLIIENFLNRYLVDTFGFEDLEGLRLSFAQKAKLIPQSGSAATWVRPGIIQLNSVRNHYGHKLDHSVQFHTISAISEVLSVSRRGKEFTNPIDAIEAFAPVACAFLCVPPKHLQTAFMQAFRDVHSYTPEPM